MRMIAWLNWAGWVLAGGVQVVCAQSQAPATATKASASASVSAPTTSATSAEVRKSPTKDVRALEKKLPKPKAEAKSDFDLSAPRQERFKKYLSKSWNTLSQREPYHIVALGDSVFDLWKDESEPVQPAFPAAFARELASQFFYTGGVYEIGAMTGDRRLLGPSIGVRQMARPGGSVLDAPRILATTARQTPVDLVLLCYGPGEAAMGMSPTTFAHAVQEALDAAKAVGADVILCAPWLQLAEHAETQLGAARPLSDVLREIAQQEGVLFADLGDLARLTVPEPTKADEGRVFDALERMYRGFFHEESGGRFTPRAALHGQLGSLIFKTLLDGSPVMPWTMLNAVAKQTESEHLAVEFSLGNSSDKDLDVTVLPLIAAGWKPVQITPLVHVPAGGKQLVTAQYARLGPDAAPVQEAVVRMPVLITAGARARVEDVRAPVEPLAVVWGLETLFNQEGSFSAGCGLTNSSAKNIKGNWQAELGGKLLEGAFEVKAHGVLPLDLHFNLPTDGPAAQVLPLVLTVKAEGGVHLVAHRQVEIVRNLGLAKPIGLRALDGSKTGADAVVLRAAATEKEVTFACVLDKADLLNDAPVDGSPAWQLEVNLDARSYGKRLERGTTATLQATGTAGDGAGIVHEVAPWCFGNDYSAAFEPKEFKAALTTAPDGKRQITLTIPRTYLYLHEWAMNNGNSQIGLNIRLTFRNAPIGAPGGLTTYALTVNTNAPEDVESLAVLELTAEPTKRATVSVY